MQPAAVQEGDHFLRNGLPRSVIFSGAASVCSGTDPQRRSGLPVADFQSTSEQIRDHIACLPFGDLGRFEVCNWQSHRQY